MNRQDALKLQVMLAIRQWMRSEQLNQKQAAKRLGLYYQQVGEICRLSTPNSLGWLLKVWDASGGEAKLELRRP